MFSLQRAGEWAAVPSLTLSAWIKTEKLHSAEIAPGGIYLCRNALEQQLKESAALKAVRIQAKSNAKTNAKGD